MSKSTLAYRYGKTFWLCLLFIFLFLKTSAQHVFKGEDISKKISIHKQIEFIDVGDKNLTIQDIRKYPDSAFEKAPDENLDFGFTANHYWLRFTLINNTEEEQNFYFETARPITDFAELYVIKENNDIIKYISGDAIPYHNRSLDLRKTIFKIHLRVGESKQYYLHVKSDGEMLTMPLILHKTQNLLEESAFEQFVFGFFYGILIIASILYLFFFFAMRDNTFFYYSMYVLFIGLLQFAIDGYFYKFITPGAGWFSLHAVAIFACVANFFLGRYAQVFLKIKEHNLFIFKCFYLLYILDGLLLLSLFILPEALKFAYPLANALGLILLGLIIASQISIYNKTKQIDKFFAIGILFLISGFVVFILKNFSILPLNFWTENGSKLGTGLEVVFLSLSMANLIRNLKNEREALQTIALQRSEEMNELKSYFLSNISHELRTPLNAIMSLSDATANEIDTERIKYNCDIIKYSSQSLLSSVNDILDFSKIEKSEIKLELAPFNPSRIIEQIKTAVTNTANDKGLKIDFHIADNFPKKVIGDGARFTQITNNIINNAIKFTNEGYIKIELDWAENLGNTIKLIFRVTDTGVGIPKEKMNSIYDSFSQESIDNKRKFGGLGLGLFIVKSLVNLQNGKIDIKSEQGLGTLCTIELDFEMISEEAKMIPMAINDEFDLKGKRILVVEDNVMNQMVIKMITKKWLNTTIEFANNGEDGVNQLKIKPFDLILMDLQMPVMDGYEATIAIRKGDAGEKNKNIPIIAVTADVMESTKKRVMEIGMNKYLSKPVNKDILFESITALV